MRCLATKKMIYYGNMMLITSHPNGFSMGFPQIWEVDGAMQEPSTVENIAKVSKLHPRYVEDLGFQYDAVMPWISTGFVYVFYRCFIFFDMGIGQHLWTRTWFGDVGDEHPGILMILMRAKGNLRCISIISIGGLNFPLIGWSEKSGESG